MLPLPMGSGVVFAEVRRNNGRTVTLADGSQIKAGDTIVEIHINNNWFKQRHRLNMTASRVAREMLVYFAHDLGILAKELDDGMFAQAVALHGCTHIGVAAGRLGFQVQELPSTLWKRSAQFYVSGLVQVYGPRRSNGRIPDEPVELKEVWLSKRALLRRYRHPGPAGHA